jgi:hypothetical protein
MDHRAPGFEVLHASSHRFDAPNPLTPEATIRESRSQVTFEKQQLLRPWHVSSQGAV